MKADATIPVRKIIAVEMGRGIICREQKIQVAVPVKVSNREASPHLRYVELSSDLVSHIMKFAAAEILEKLRCLRVADIPANVPYRFVNVAVGHSGTHPPV